MFIVLLEPSDIRYVWSYGILRGSLRNQSTFNRRIENKLLDLKSQEGRVNETEGRKRKAQRKQGPG